MQLIVFESQRKFKSCLIWKRRHYDKFNERRIKDEIMDTNLMRKESMIVL